MGPWADYMRNIIAQLAPADEVSGDLFNNIPLGPSYGFQDTSFVIDNALIAVSPQGRPGTPPPAPPPPPAPCLHCTRPTCALQTPRAALQSRLLAACSSDPSVNAATDAAGQRFDHEHAEHQPGVRHELPARHPASQIRNALQVKDTRPSDLETRRPSPGHL